VPDVSSCAEALDIARRYDIGLPPAVVDALQRGTLETPKPDDAVFDRQTVQLIATPAQSLQAAAEAARAAGLAAHVLSDEIEGEAHDIGGMHGALARAAVRDT
jgi:hydroxypyruvate reductase